MAIPTVTIPLSYFRELVEHYYSAPREPEHLEDPKTRPEVPSDPARPIAAPAEDVPVAPFPPGNWTPFGAAAKEASLVDALSKPTSRES